MPGFEDSAVIVLLALLLFGPKKLPELARQFGKLMADFRRASSEFRTQMEDELRLSEQAERQKQIAATPAATSAATSAIASTETPAIDIAQSDPDPYSEAGDPDADQYSSRQQSSLDSAFDSVPESIPHAPPESQSDPASDSTHLASLESTARSTPEAAPIAQPIATSGELSIQPPATGLPTPHTAADASDSLPLPFGESAESAAAGSTASAHSGARETEALHG